jgi:hypothetical protein
MKRAVLIALAMGFLVAGLPAPASAAFPGHNGRLAVAIDDKDIPASGDIWTVTSTEVLKFLDGDPDYGEPAWSPDGTRMALAGRTCPGTFCDPSDIYVISADGTGLTQLTHGAGNDVSPAWSPDGERIAFIRTADSFSGFALYVMNADGSDETHLADGAASPAWSPDGTEIAFSGLGGIYTIAPDGSSQRFVSDGIDPDWSPDGSKLLLAQAGTGDFASNLVTVNRNGTGLTTLLADGYWNLHPAWSPEGDQVVFDRQYCERDPDFGDFCDHDRDVYKIDADGSDLEIVTDICCGNYDEVPNWQPIPVTHFPRPKAAATVHLSLVPAYRECSSPDRTHGPPLAFPSCTPVPASPNVTVGTPDANGAESSFVGSLALSVVAGNVATPADEADVGVSASLTDVRCYEPAGPITTCGESNASAGQDYVGELSVAFGLRITDRDNNPYPGGPSAGTVSDATVDLPFSCGNNLDATAGAVCSLSTSLDAAIPGVAKESRRAVWQVGQVQVLDGGPDGDAATDGNSTFARQGLSIP